MAKKIHWFKKHDHVIAAWAESANGPGWANSPVWVLVRSHLDGGHRVECLQPSEQTDEIITLYGVSKAAHLAMTSAVSRAVRKSRQKREEDATS